MPAYCISNPLYHLAGFLFFLNFKFLRELEREGFMLLQNNCLHLIPCELKPPPNFSHNKCAACRLKRQQTRLNTGLYPGLFLHHCLHFLLHTPNPSSLFLPFLLPFAYPAFTQLPASSSATRHSHMCLSSELVDEGRNWLCHV